MEPMGALMLDVEGTSLTQNDKKRLQNPTVGGVVLFSTNFEHRDQLIDLVRSIRSLCPHILIAVDHEGGRIQRFKDGFTIIPSMSLLGALWQQNSAQAICVASEVGWLLASELLACGIDLSFTPVLDLNFGTSEIIGDRAFGRDPLVVSHLAAALISGLRSAGMACVGKHFPGHGYVAADSHLTLPVDERSWDEIAKEDLVPFERLAPCLDGVMPAHVRYQQLDDAPAGFSRYWLKNVLRDTLGFDGLIFSDDLSMEGAAEYGSYPNRAQLALDAGCDMVLVCYNPEGVDAVLGAEVFNEPVEPRRAERLRVDWQGIPNWSQLKRLRRWGHARDTVQSLIGG